MTSVNSNVSYSSETPIMHRSWQLFVPCDLEIWRMTLKNKANLRDLIAATGKLDSNRWLITGVTLKFDEWPKKTIRHLFYTTSSFVHHWCIQTEVRVRKHSIRVKIGNFFVPCDLEILWMTLENKRAPLLYHIKLCASFHSYDRIQTGVTVRKRSIRVTIGDFLSRVTLKFDRWPWKRIGHLFDIASSFVHHLIAICEFKRVLQSGNAQFGSKSMFFVLCEFEIWQMTLKNNRAPHLYYIKLCASFRSHWWNQTGVTVRKRPIRIKIGNFQIFTDDLEKQ